MVGTVIDEVDEVLHALVKRDALTGTDVEVVFDAPTKDWASRRNAPTVDIYLYDIREDLKRREVGRRDARGTDGLVTGRQVDPIGAVSVLRQRKRRETEGNSPVTSP